MKNFLQPDDMTSKIDRRAQYPFIQYLYCIFHPHSCRIGISWKMAHVTVRLISSHVQNNKRNKGKNQTIRFRSNHLNHFATQTFWMPGIFPFSFARSMPQSMLYINFNDTLSGKMEKKILINNIKIIISTHKLIEWITTVWLLKPYKHLYNSNVIETGSPRGISDGLVLYAHPFH